ncbi:single-stranded-DNA-specific exonuclease RecJ [Methanobrevibacter olleyae]|uniref:RecJ-like exonuclease n=1 Tax=Methanobrevibacter olleyae TaxID=294671 RepID=A0A126QZQ0_METOL|nr:single-stranded-DNA-specific exonuclease RecJ [Methanobrevibacter olleyae]AMK15590.1 single-stranded DNA exonuclease RecJ related protein [Methanobrevibacter olleyae]SFL81102.1 RecJ-like exonuclease [Methanobrevibacter olleyae]
MRETLPPEMKKRYEQAKELLENSDNIKIYSHTDCDGISSGAILTSILERLGKRLWKNYEIEIVNLDVLEDLPIEHELTIFSDLGSGQPVDKNANKDSKIIILDHHPPLRDIDYCEKVDYTYLEINPIFYGIDGSQEICGGGLSYLLAKEFGFKDLSWIGVLAAIGDMQNSKTGKLEGLNNAILKDAKEEGLVSSKTDLSLYGKQTRPLFAALSYFSDVKLPITNNQNETIALIKKLKIPLRNTNDEATTLSDLNDNQKKLLISELIKMISLEIPPKYSIYVPKLVIADSYEFLKEDNRTFLRDASEFSTAMNACVRNDRSDVALKILGGNRVDALDELEIISKTHRAYLAKNIQSIGESKSIIEMDNLQYFDGTGIRSNVVGTIAGMILSYGDWRKPIIAFTQISEENEDLKISLRCSRLLAYDGIHFGEIIREVAQSLGGNGGGHNVACGAYIPKDKKDEFLNLMNEKLKGKLAIEY